jgi:two-component system, cell cycle sensor histidine kinase and response regulator CckA
MEKPLRVLVIEDSEDDTLLLVRTLRKAGYAPAYKRIETATAMVEAVERQGWDLIISDHSMPHFSAVKALEILKQKNVDVPLIIVSGTIGEDSAVEAMRHGAADYIMKGNAGRLIPAIERELREARNREAKRRSETAFRRLLESNFVGIFMADTVGGITEANDAFLKLVGYTSVELPLRWDLLTPEEWRETDRKKADELRLTGTITPYEKEYFRKDGTRVPILIGAASLADAGQGEVNCIAFVLDLSYRRQAEQVKHALEEQLRQAQKMEAVGRLAGGVAHDFNNILTVILGYCQFLGAQAPADSPMRAATVGLQPPAGGPAARAGSQRRGRQHGQDAAPAHRRGHRPGH